MLMGYIEFPHSGGNYATIPIAIPVDASVEIRVDCIVPPVPAVGNDYRPYALPLNLLFGNAVVQGAFRNSSGVMRPTGNRTYAQLASAGFPAIGGRVHMRTVWDAVADTVRWEWRPLSGRALTDGTAWILPSSVTAAYPGEAIDNTWVSMMMSANTAASAFLGRIYRWTMHINGVLYRDVNPSLNLIPGHENDSTFEATLVGGSDELDRSTAPLHDAYVGKGTTALVTADTGQTWHHSGGFPLSIIDNAVGNLASGTPQTAGYIDVDAGAEGTRIGAEFEFLAAGSTSTGFATILMWALPFQLPIPDSPCHLGVSPVFASLSIWDAAVNTVLWSHVFTAPLDTDTVYYCDIIRNGNTLTVRLPDGTLRSHTDSRIGSLNGDNVGVEVFHLASDTDHRPRFTEVWADTAVLSPSLLQPGQIVTVARTGSPATLLVPTVLAPIACPRQTPDVSSPLDRLVLTACPEEVCS